MPIVAQPTPNPNARKFTVGVEVGGPRSYGPDGAGDDPMVSDIFGVAGVVSVFATADFVTITKSPEADWSLIGPAVAEILSGYFPDS